MVNAQQDRNLAALLPQSPAHRLFAHPVQLRNAENPPFSRRRTGPRNIQPPWIAGCFELVLGFLVLVGFKTRPAAFVLSGVMAFAYFLRHAPQGFYPSQNGGVAAILFCFVFLYLFSAGPGPISVDAKLSSKRV
jgi:uncharacterized membrane protein YphA (DoxX/SURF4 family)